MKRSRPESTFSITTEAVRTKKSAFLGRDQPGTTYVVWCPQDGAGNREFGTFRKARLYAHGLSEKHPKRNYRVFKTCWARPADEFALREVPASVKATAVELT